MWRKLKDKSILRRVRVSFIERLKKVKIKVYGGGVVFGKLLMILERIV